MTECVYCQHVEMCGWREDAEGQGCEFFDDGNKWIPISKRLPQYTADYIVTVGINNGDGMYYEVRTALYQTRFNQWIVYESEKTLVGEVIAWQDSAKPYKAERSDKECSKL